MEQVEVEVLVRSVEMEHQPQVEMVELEPLLLCQVLALLMRVVVVVVFI
jgi:hypothetical protein